MTSCATAELATTLRLFASVFAREADEALLRGIMARRSAITGTLGRDPLSDLPLADIGTCVGALAVDYCCLFIGPHGHLPPVESVAMGEERFWGPSTESVVLLYRSLGIALSPGNIVLPDHISMELDCLAVLEEQDRSAEARSFAREHLLRWLPTLIRHVDERASLAFYPAWCRGAQTLLTELYGGES